MTGCPVTWGNRQLGTEALQILGTFCPTRHFPTSGKAWKNTSYVNSPDVEPGSAHKPWD